MKASGINAPNLTLTIMILTTPGKLLFGRIASYPFATVVRQMQRKSRHSCQGKLLIVQEATNEQDTVAACGAYQT